MSKTTERAHMISFLHTIIDRQVQSSEKPPFAVVLYGEQFLGNLAARLDRARKSENFNTDYYIRLQQRARQMNWGEEHDMLQRCIEVSNRVDDDGKPPKRKVFNEEVGECGRAALLYDLFMKNNTWSSIKDALNV